MNIAYPIPEILKCIEIIHQPKKKFYKNNDKTLNLNNTAIMKKKINQTQNTFGEIVETEEFIEETFDDAKPFEIDEITKINDSGMKKNKKKETKPSIKIKKSKALLLTTEVVNQSSREKTLKTVLEESGDVLVHPYNNERIIAGQGTAAKELLEDYPDLDCILSPVSGGGLLSGSIISAKSLNFDIQVFLWFPYFLRSGLDHSVVGLRKT